MLSFCLYALSFFSNTLPAINSSPEFTDYNNQINHTLILHQPVILIQVSPKPCDTLTNTNAQTTFHKYCQHDDEICSDINCNENISHILSITHTSNGVINRIPDLTAFNSEHDIPQTHSISISYLQSMHINYKPNSIASVSTILVHTLFFCFNSCIHGEIQLKATGNTTNSERVIHGIFIMCLIPYIGTSPSSTSPTQNTNKDRGRRKLSMSYPNEPSSKPYANRYIVGSIIGVCACVFLLIVVLFHEVKWARPPDPCSHEVVSWLLSKEADPNFIDHVQCVMNGEYNPIELHPELSHYCESIMETAFPVHSPTDMANELAAYLESDAIEASTHDFGIFGHPALYQVVENRNNIILAQTLNKHMSIIVCMNRYITGYPWPKRTVLTVLGDFRGTIVNTHENAMIVLNVIGDFSGIVKCVNGGNIFIKCNNYRQSYTKKNGIIHIKSRNNDKYWKRNIHQYGNYIVVSRNDITFDSCVCTTRDVKKNLFGNMYLQAHEDVNLRDGARIVSGSIRVVCNDLNGTGRRNTIEASRGQRGDLSIELKNGSLNGPHIEFHPTPV